MGDSSRPPASTSTTSKGGKGNPNIQLNRAALFRQSSIRRGHCVQRNLLPSKVSLEPPGATAAHPPVSQNRNGQSINSSFSVGRGCKPKPQTTQQQLLELQYGSYLQNFLETALLKEMKELDTMRQADKMAKSCVRVSEMETDMNRIFAERKITSLNSKIAFLDKVRLTFDHLTGFFGAGALAEIQAVLVEKHEKLLLNKGTVEEPLFQESELDDILKSLRKEKPVQVEMKHERVIGFVYDYVKKLKTLIANSETVAKNMEDLEEASNTLLIESSLLASEIAMKNEQNGKSRSMGLFQRGSPLAGAMEQVRNSGGKTIQHVDAASMEATTTFVSSNKVNYGSFDKAENGSPITPKDPLQLSFLV